jgi:uncharacterized membrane protein
MSMITGLQYTIYPIYRHKLSNRLDQYSPSQDTGYKHFQGANVMRPLKKTISFGIVHVLVAFSVVYAFTGSIALGGVVAMIEPALNTIAYFFHEKVWERLPAGTRKGSRNMTVTA